ncbi:MAG: glycosyltransferase family 1 protein [Chloroflexi bacterium]|nr:glycosyltransferase family 1 protein [Chloroflexota bacterium]
MHIAINAQLLSDQASYRGAGVSNYSRHLLQHLGQSVGSGGTEHHFTAFINTPDFQADGITLALTRPSLQQPLARIVWEQLVLPLKVHQLHADLVHGLVNVLPLTTAKPGVVTVHDLSFVRMPEKLRLAKRLYLARLCQASVTKAAHVIAVSQQTADDLMGYFDVAARKISVVHNGVTAAFTPGTPQQAAQFRTDRALPERFLLYVGTLEPRKNLTLLIKAFAQWRSQASAEDRSLKLILAGAKGWFYTEIFQWVKTLGLEQDVLFPGFIPDADLPAWYRAAEGFVYPSLLEGFGLPVLEAMACGTPVLCSQIPSLLEIIGDSALTFPAHDEAALAASLALLINQSALRVALRQKGLAQARNFSWQRTAQATIAVYNQIAP